MAMLVGVGLCGRAAAQDPPKSDPPKPDLPRSEPETAPQDGVRIVTELTLDYASKYVWHGLNLVNDGVFQPEIALSRGGLSLSFWGNLETTNSNRPRYGRDSAGHLTEVDTSLSYSGARGATGWSLGVIDYQYPRTGYPRYREWVVGVSRDVPWGGASLEVHTNLGDLTGTYATLGLTGSVPTRLGHTQAIDLGFELTYGDVRCNRFLYDYDAPAFTDAHLSAGMTFACGPAWSLGVTAHASALLASDLMRGQPRRQNAWLNLSLGTAF